MQQSSGGDRRVQRELGGERTEETKERSGERRGRIPRL